MFVLFFSDKCGSLVKAAMRKKEGTCEFLFTYAFPDTKAFG